MKIERLSVKGEAMEKDIYNNLLAQGSKYTYYLLSIAAGCIALTLKRIENLTIELNLILVGLAILSWGLSFICGCYNRRYLKHLLASNFNLIQEQNRLYKKGCWTKEVEVETKESLQIFEKHTQKEYIFSKWQWRLLISGAIFYIVWQILNMMNN